MKTPTTDDQLRVPESLRREVEQIFGLTDPFCAEHLDAEYSRLVRKVIAKLARKLPSPLARGNLRIWAGAAIYAVGSVNFLFDRAQIPHLSGDDLSALIGVPKRTLAAKAKSIRDVLRIGQSGTEFGHSTNPMAWSILFNGFIVDARRMSPAVQAEARRLGLIPDPPAPAALAVDGPQPASDGGKQ